MKIERRPDGSYRIADGTDALELDCLAYEDLYCSVPLENVDFEMFVRDMVLADEQDRAALQRMTERAGGTEPAMGALQAALRALPPPSAADSGEAGLETVAPAAAPVPGKVCSILLVEADDWDVKAFQERIAGSRFRIAERVSSVSDGLAYYKKSRTNLVVLDLTAQGADVETIGGGLDPVRRFLDIQKDCALVVTCSYETRRLVLAAVRAGANGHLVKPFERADLLALLNKALTSRSHAPAPRGQVVKKTLACAWKPEGGLLAAWKDFPGRSIDMKGLDAMLPEKFKEGSKLRIKIELPGAKKPLETAAEVASCRWDSAMKSAAVRFKFLGLTLDGVQSLAHFLNTNTKPQR